MNKFIFYIMNRLVGIFTVDVYKNPEYLSNNGKTCNRNKLVAECLIALSNLKRDIIKH